MESNMVKEESGLEPMAKSMINPKNEGSAPYRL